MRVNMKLQIVLILAASAYLVNSQFLNSDQDLSQILESVNMNDLNNLQVLANNNLPSLAFLLDFLQQYSFVQNSTQSILSTENECTRQLKMYMNELMKMEEWALKMFDATAKLQPGLLEGNLMQMGHYDECLKIEVSVNGTKINGQYCSAAIMESKDETIDIETKENLLQFIISFGVCVPTACNALHLTRLSRSMEEVLNSPSHLVFDETFCDSSIKVKPLSTMTVVAIVFFSIMGIIIALSTLYDLAISYMTDKKAVDLFIAFSLYTNGQKLFATKKSADVLGCLNGMRVISMLWIVGAHQFQYTTMMPTINLLDIAQWTDSTISVFITAGNMAVDTFFVISGLLVVYVFLKSKESGRNVSVPMMYVHRIIRLTPSLAIVMLFLATCVSYIASGPFWHGVVVYLANPCKNNWWPTLLYIQNYVNPDDSCVGQAWYLAVDTQLYFLSPLLLFPLIKWPKRTILVTLLLTVLCCVGTFEITWLKELSPAHYGLTAEMMKELYMPTHVRATTWLVGFITGYIIFNCRNKVIKISKMVVVLLWLFSLCLMMGIILYHDRLRINSQIDLLEASLFNALSRLLWALGLSLMIFLCVTGHGGFINKFLSSPIFTVLIRVNYSMYLLHITVILYLAGQGRTPEYGSLTKNFYIFWGDSVITLLISIVWTLSFESPIIALEKIIFGKKSGPSPAPKILNNISVVVVDDKVTNSEKTQ